VPGLCIQLIGILELHETHGRTRGRFSNGFRISIIVLPSLHVRLDIFRRHQPHFVPLILQYATKVVRITARLHGVSPAAN
jgi:hypothetical protein